MTTLGNPRFVSKQDVFSGQCCASFGEIIQGVLPNDEHFLVTLPIATFTAAHFFPGLSSKIKVFPTSKTKVRKFLEKLRQTFERDFSGTFIIKSEIPEGKGLSSSTADMISALRSVENYYGESFDTCKIGPILESIEPSDGLLYEGSIIYYHRKCTFVKHLGKLPKLLVLCVDFGGTIDTVIYNKCEKTRSPALKKEYEELLSKLTRAFEENDLETIGKIATQSARLNQPFNYKKDLEAFIDIAEKVGAFGTVNTHSGTCLGLLTDPSGEHLGDTIKILENTFPKKKLHIYCTI